MRRRDFIAGAGVVGIWPLAAWAQQPVMKHVGILIPVPEARVQRNLAAFREGLQAFGWVEGKNVRFTYGSVENAGDFDAATLAAARTLIAGRPDVILADDPAAVDALRRLAVTLPVVFVDVSDPISYGIAASLARPGGNFTGLTTYELAMGGKWVALLKELAPSVTRVGAIFNPQVGTSAYLDSARASAGSLGMALTAIPVTDASEIAPAIQAFAATPGGGIFSLPNAWMIAHRDALVAAVAQSRLPAIYWHEGFTAAGGLAAYAIDYLDEIRRAGRYVDRILRGETPSDMPIEAASKFNLIINQKTAHAMGFSIPPLLLARADEVIE